MSADARPPGLVARWWPALRRRRGVAAAVFGVVLAVAVAAVFLARPVYRAEALLQLGEPPPSPGVSPSVTALSFFRGGGDPFANDLELLASRSLAEAVVRDVALVASLDAPRGWHRDSVFLALAGGDSTIEASYRIGWTDADHVEVRRMSPRDSLVARAAVGEPVDLDGVTVVPGRRRPGGPERVAVATRPVDEAVRALAGALEVTRTRREANVLQIAYAHTDPGVAGAVVEAVVDRFVAMRGGLFARASGQTVDSLRAVAASTQRELAEAEAALEDTQRTTGMVAPDAQADALVDRYEALLHEREEVRAEQALMAAQIDRVERATDPLEAWTTLVATPAFLANETVGQLLARLTALAGERTELRSRRTGETRASRTLDERIAQLDLALRNLAREYRTGLAERREGLEARVAQLEVRLDAVPAQAVELGRRQRSVRLLSELVVLTEQRLRQEELREALNVSTVQVIDPPAVRYRPVWPRKRLGLAVGLLLAFGAAALTVVVVEAADDRVRTASELEGLGLPLFGAIPAGNGTVPGPAAGARAHLPPGALLVGCPGDGASTRAVAASLGIDGERVVEAPTGPADLSPGLRPDGPVVLVVRPGRTTRAEVERTRRWVVDAGGRVVGAVAALGARDRVDEVWS